MGGVVVLRTTLYTLPFTNERARHMRCRAAAHALAAAFAAAHAPPLTTIYTTAYVLLNTVLVRISFGYHTYYLRSRIKRFVEISYLYMAS